MDVAFIDVMVELVLFNGFTWVCTDKTTVHKLKALRLSVANT